jgi:hypothetical protein
MSDPLKNAARAAEVMAPALDEIGGPIGLAGRLIGMGADEVDAGVPGWAWFGIGVVAGATAMYFLKDRVEAFARD